MKRILIPILLFLLLIATPSASAHPGRTDANGGHTDSSTGEYHYHHGYPAHQHYDMDGDGKKDCPYEFKDKTGSASGTSSKSTSSVTSTKPSAASGLTPLTYTSPAKTSSNPDYTRILLLLFIAACVFLIRQMFQKQSLNNTITELYGKLNSKERENKELLDSSVKLVSDEILKNKIMEEELNELESRVSDLEAKNAMLESQCQQLGILLSDTDHAKDILALSLNQYKAERADLVHQLQLTYGKDFLVPLSGAPRGAFVDNAFLPHRYVSKGDDQYTLHRSSTGKFHTKSCPHYSSCISIPALDVHKSDFNRNRCMICNPQYPDLTWYMKYRHLVDITKNEK